MRGKSRRTVALPAIAVTALRVHRKCREYQHLLAESRWQEHGLVFITTIGMPLDYANVTRIFQKMLRAASLHKQRLRDLRHCAATMLIAQGADSDRPSSD